MFYFMIQNLNWFLGIGYILLDLQWLLRNNIKLQTMAYQWWIGNYYYKQTQSEVDIVGSKTMATQTLEGANSVLKILNKKYK